MKHERTEVNPQVMFGKPVIRGTRIAVELILRKLARGMTAEDILRDHPHLTIADIHAAEAFAAGIVPIRIDPARSRNVPICLNMSAAGTGSEPNFGFDRMSIDSSELRQKRCKWLCVHSG